MRKSVAKESVSVFLYASTSVEKTFCVFCSTPDGSTFCKPSIISTDTDSVLSLRKLARRTHPHCPAGIHS